MKRRKVLLIVAIVMAGCGTVVAEARRVPEVKATQIIAEIERAGQAYARPANGKSAQAIPFEYSGSHERRCVEANGTKAVRSGEIIAGPFDSYRPGWLSGYAKLWWTPLYPEFPRKDMLAPGAIVATRVNFADLSTRETLDRTAWNGGWFYPSIYSLPWFGRWAMVVTAGPNWGCFLFTV